MRPAPAHELTAESGYRALARLARLAGEGGAPEQLAARALDVLVEALAADGGEVFLDGDGGRRSLARAGAHASSAPSFAAAPLLASGRTVGGVECAAAREHAFGPPEHELLAAAASLLGPPLAGAPDAGAQSLLELHALHRVADKLSRSLDLDEVLGHCLDTALEVAHAPAGSIYLYDHTRGVLTRVASRGLADEVAPFTISAPGIRDRYLKHGTRIIDVDDPGEQHPLVAVAQRHRFRRMIILPLKSDADLVGLLSINFYASADVAAAVPTLEAIAGQEAVAIENARAHRTVELRARLALILREFGEHALAPPENLDVDQLILRTALELSRTDRGVICRIDGGRARVEHAVGKDTRLLGLELALDEPYLRDALASPKPFVVEDTAQLDPATTFGRIAREMNTGSFVLLVMRRHGQPLGLLFTASDERRRYEDEETEAMQILASTAAEVTVRSRVQAEARAEHRRLDQIIEHLPIVIAVLGTNGETLHLNAAGRALAQELAPPSLEDWRESIRHIQMLYPDGRPIPREDLLIAHAFAGNTPPQRELTLVSADGVRRRAVIAVAAPLVDERGTVTAVVTSFQDVSALRELADAKDRFLRVASHELRSPITSLRATVSLLEMDPTAISDERRRAQLLARVQRQVDRLIKLVEQLLDSARLNTREVPLQTAECDLVTLAGHAIELTPTLATGHRIVLEQDGPVVGVWDPLRIEQVLTNLISNAVRYSASGSPIIVRVRGGARVRGGDPATIEVADEGIGIPADQLDRVFTPFFRASNAASLHKGGLGLGLHITAEIVQRHGGRIRVTSQVGVGSTFTVELPRDIMETEPKGDGT